MAAFDKWQMKEKLKALGWTEDENATEPWRMIPPADLWERKAKTFYVYDAETIQELLVPGSTWEPEATDAPVKGDRILNQSTGRLHEWDGKQWILLPA